MLRCVLPCFLLLLAGAGLGAETDTAAPAVEEAAGTEDTASPEDIDAAIAEEIRAAEEAAANAPPLDANEPFIPTVQISEDLSVSFPVDI